MPSRRAKATNFSTTAAFGLSLASTLNSARVPRSHENQLADFPWCTTLPRMTDTQLKFKMFAPVVVGMLLAVATAQPTSSMTGSMGGGMTGSTGGSPMPGTAAACLAAAQSLLQCQSIGPAGWMGPWTQPNLDSRNGVMSSPCCSIDLMTACGSPMNFFHLWRDSSLLESSKMMVLMSYMGTCPGGVWRP